MIKILEQIHEVRPWKKHTQRYEKGVSKILIFDWDEEHTYEKFQAIERDSISSATLSSSYKVASLPKHSCARPRS